MGEKLEIHVLDAGFLVKNKDYMPIAGFTTVFDLTAWLHDRFGPVKAAEAVQAAVGPKIELTKSVAVVSEAPAQDVEDRAAQEPQTEPPAEPAAPSSALSPQQERVYAHLCRCLEKTGGEIVEINVKTLALKAEVPVGSIYFLLSKLQDRGVIEWIKRGPNADPQFKLLGEPAARAA